MKRFTLTLVAVMITALSFAQRTVQPSKASLSALKSEMAIPQFKMERPTGKIAEAKVSAKAPAMAPTIISDTPAGTLKTYTRSGSNYDYNSTTGAFELSEQSGTIKIVFSTDGKKAYIQNPISGDAEFGSWVEGDLSDDGKKITVSMGQYIGYFDQYSAGLFLGVVDYDTTNNEFTWDKNVTEVTYTIGDDDKITLNGTSATKVFAAVWDDDETIYRADFESVYTPYTFEEPDKVTPPEGLETTTLTWVGRAYINGYQIIKYNVKIGFNDTEVYLQGFDRDLPDAWIYGELDADNNVIVFPAGQYLGLDDESNPHYLVGSEDLDEMADLVYNYKQTTDGKTLLTQRTTYYSLTYDLESVATNFNYLGYGSGMHNITAVTPPSTLETRLYTLTYQHMSGSGATATGTESKLNVEFGIADGKAYLKGVDAAADTKGWLVGTVSGNKITFEAPQLFDADGKAVFLAYSRESQGIVDNIVFNYDSTTKYITQSDGNTLVVNSELIGRLYFYELMENAQTGEFEEPEKVTPPTGMETVDAFLASSTYDAGVRTTDVLTNLKVGFADEDVYVQGFDTKLPDNWIKGTLDTSAGTVTFDVQYIGMDEDQIFHYLVGTSGSDVSNLTFSYKTTEDGKFIMQLPSGTFYSINKSATALSFVYYGYNAAIHNLAPITEKPAGLENNIYTYNYQILAGSGSSITYTDATKNVMFGILGDKAYIKGIANAATDVWIVGKVNGDKITFDTPQSLSADGSIVLLGYDLANGVFLDKVEFSYDPATKYISQTDDAVLIVNSVLLNGLYSYERLAHGQTAAFSDEIVTPPAGLTTSTRYFEGRKNDNSFARQNITVGIDNQDVYIKGIFAEMPEAWVKGTLDESGNITIPTNQYLGLVDDVTRYLVGYKGGVTDIVATKSPQGIYRTTTYVFPTSAKSSTTYIGYFFTASAVAPALPESVTAPTSLTTADFKLTATSGITGEQTVKVGFDGDDVYFQGIYNSTNYVNAWVKGTKNGEGKYVFTTPQRLGNYYTYFCGYDANGLVDEVVFDYDAATNTFTAEGNYCINSNIANRYPYQSVVGAKLVGPNPDGINAINAVKGADESAWYTVNGVRVAAPTQKGLYIHNGKKVVIK